MQDVDSFLKTLQHGKTWLEAMLEMSVDGTGLKDPRKCAIETLRRREFENNAKTYLKDVPEICELIKPGRNDTKLKMKSKLSDIVLLGKEIIGDNKQNFENSLNNFKHQMREIINETKLLREEIKLLKIKELQNKSNEISGYKISQSTNTNINVSPENKTEKSEFVNASDLNKHVKEKQSYGLDLESEILIKTKYGNYSSDKISSKLEHSEKVTPTINYEIVKKSSETWHECESVLFSDSLHKKNMIKRPLSISDEFISVDKDTVRHMYCGRTEKSIGISKNSLKELKENSLNNLLVQSDFSFPSSRSINRQQPYREGLVIRELYELLTKKKFPCGIHEEIEIFSENLYQDKSAVESVEILKEAAEENEENYFDKESIVTVVSQTNYNTEKERTRKENDVFEKLTANIRRYYELTNNEIQNPTDLPRESISKSTYDHSSVHDSDPNSVHDSDCNPRMITVQQVTDMLFSLSSILEQIPEELKHSKMEDLNPPQSMKNAISLLAHISKSVDIVQLSESFYVDEPLETESSDHSAVLESKLGHYSLLGRHEYNCLRSTAVNQYVQV